MSPAEARMRAFLAACEQAISESGDRARGLATLRDMAMEGFSPAILALAGELVRAEADGIPERPEDWALAAYALRHIAPLERLLARMALAGEDTALLCARRDRQVQADPQQLLQIGTNAEVREAIGMVEAGDPHRVFGLELLRKMARKGVVSAGLVYAEELVADAPARQRAARAGWAESAAALGHHTPMLRLIAMTEREGNADRAAELRARHEAILTKAFATDTVDVPEGAPDPAPELSPEPAPEPTVEDPARAEAQAAAEQGAAKRASERAAADHTATAARQQAEREAAQQRARQARAEAPADAPRPARACAEASPYWPLHVLLVLVLLGSVSLLSPGWRTWLSDHLVPDFFAAAPDAPTRSARTSSGGGPAPSTGSGRTSDLGTVSLTASAATYLDGRIDEAEARADALLKQGKEKEADDAVVAAIEAAMVAGDLDKLERLLDRQQQVAVAVERAEKRDTRAMDLLKRIMARISKGFEFRQRTGRGSSSHEYVRFWSPAFERSGPVLGCTLDIAMASSQGSPQRYLPSRPNRNPLRIDLAKLHDLKAASVDARGLDFVDNCPDSVLTYGDVSIGFCRGTLRQFKAALGEYLDLMGCRGG